jgi:hypothetical protein
MVFIIKDKVVPKRQTEGLYVQLQKRQVGIAVVCLAFALLHDIVLEDGRRLGIVPVETIENLVDVLRPVRRVIEGTRHGGLGMDVATTSWAMLRVTILTVEG